jgi:hypothetical protein
MPSVMKNLSTGLITIPVNFLISFITRKTDGPAGAVTIMGIALLILNLVIILPAALLYVKYPLIGSTGIEAVAQLNIITVQYVMLLPAGALIYHVTRIVKEGLHINTDLLVFLFIITPVFGTITCSIAFWVLTGTRLNIMREMNITSGTLISVQHIQGATRFSWGLFSDLMRASFPFVNYGKSIPVIILNIYTASASLYFSYRVWGFYCRAGAYRKFHPGKLKFNPSDLSATAKTFTLAGFFAMTAIATACFHYSITGYYTQHRILEHGIETLAEPDPFYKGEPGSSLRTVKYTYIAGGERITSTKTVEYTFYMYVNSRKDRMIPVKYNAAYPGENMIIYSEIYNLTPDHDNDYASFFRAFIMGIGFLGAALWLFPGRWMKNE